MTTVKERISNVIAWVGFASLLMVVCTSSFHFWYQSLEKPELVLLESCEEFDTVEYWNSNPLLSAVAKKFSSESQLERCKSDSKYISMWYYKDDVVVLTGSGYMINSLRSVDEHFDGFIDIDTYEAFDLFIPTTLPLWLISVVLNYILFGSARLLPWKKAVISEEAS
jgi:hypothetical protein